MHSKDRTLLASLGFSDPDKKNPLHDLACVFLSQDDVLGEIAKALFNTKYHDEKDFVAQETVDSTFTRIDRKQTEYILSKGEGKYKTTVGFVDVYAECERVIRQFGYRPEEPLRSYTMNRQSILIEAKIHPCQIGDLIRQVRLYLEYFPDYSKPLPVAALAFPINETAAGQLKQAKILHVHLGQRFADFAAKDKQQWKPSDASVTF